MKSSSMAGSPFLPKALIEVCSSLAPGMFTVGQHHDAEEFFNFLLGRLQDELIAGPSSLFLFFLFMSL
jgi:hypothetical protein